MTRTQRAHDVRIRRRASSFDIGRVRSHFILLRVPYRLMTKFLQKFYNAEYNARARARVCAKEQAHGAPPISLLHDNGKIEKGCRRRATCAGLDDAVTLALFGQSDARRAPARVTGVVRSVCKQLRHGHVYAAHPEKHVFAEDGLKPREPHLFRDALSAQSESVNGGLRGSTQRLKTRR